MKKLYTVLIAVMLTASAFAQAPGKMSYQAVVRDAVNVLVTSQLVGMRISILDGFASEVYIETQLATTNINGLVSLEIGSGTVVYGVFDTINWSAGTYFLKTETDPTGGTTYTITGTSQLMSVPYALHANTADSIIGGVSITETDPIFGASIANGITALDTANWNNHTIDTDTQLDSTGVANLGYVAGPHTVEIDSSITNEIQIISRTGTTVTLSNGGGTFQDSVNTYTEGDGITITGTVIAEKKYQVGDFAQGGIVFWVDETGEHGLVSAKSDQSTGVRWFAGTNGSTQAKGDGPYAGEANTLIVITAQVAIGDDGATYAARICNELQITEGGKTYGDWYLPSRVELNQMYLARGTINATALSNGGGSFTNNGYWSSTEGSSTLARGRFFFNGGFQFNYTKNVTAYVRAVRAF
ncbi:MAG: DUF1566 domain-containing protein [Crocinitomicaceae bacterium]|nr:DUF1566 domain-containing protein [Flavobacteriales bacterium]NQZ38128.1 DUF1566 domain-containing protein [Crocinitomicaceae bacterium]